LDNPPTSEGEIINEWAEPNRKLLEKEAIKKWTIEDLIQLCSRLSKGTKQKSQDECINLLANFLWNQRSVSGKSILDVITYVLYDGADKDLPVRLWEATHDEKWRIPHLGLSTLGEFVGWAKPNLFPPRNGRTSKALTALGYKVRIHSG